MASCIILPIHGYALYVCWDARGDGCLDRFGVIVDRCDRRADVEEGIVNGILGCKRRNYKVLGR